MSRAEQRERTRGLIIDTARRLFLIGGYEATTIRAIAADAGVSAGTVIGHFQDKRRLLSACFHTMLSDAIALAFQGVSQFDSLAEGLLHIAETLYAAYARHPGLSRQMVRDAVLSGPHDSVPQQTESDHLSPFLSALSAHFEAAANDGALRPLTAGESHLAAQSFFAIYLAILMGGLSGHLGNPHDLNAASIWRNRLKPLVYFQIAGLASLPAPESK